MNFSVLQRKAIKRAEFLIFSPTRDVNQFLHVILAVFNMKGDGFTHAYMINSAKTSTMEQKIYHLNCNWTTQLTRAILIYSEL